MADDNIRGIEGGKPSKATEALDEVKKTSQELLQQARDLNNARLSGMFLKGIRSAIYVILVVYAVLHILATLRIAAEGL